MEIDHWRRMNRISTLNAALLTVSKSELVFVKFSFSRLQSEFDNLIDLTYPLDYHDLAETFRFRRLSQIRVEMERLGRSMQVLQERHSINEKRAEILNDRCKRLCVAKTRADAEAMILDLVAMRYTVNTSDKIK